MATSTAAMPLRTIAIVFLRVLVLSVSRLSQGPPYRQLAVLFGLTLLLANPSAAQQARTGRLEGRVLDSARAKPLVGARVVAVGVGERSSTTADASTDEKGDYHIDALPPGRYLVGFESPIVDSLEITLAPRQVDVVEGRTARIDLGLPPAAKLRASMCPGVPLPPQTGAIYGRVIDPETQRPLSDALLALSWRETTVNRKTLRAETHERTASATTDASGWYRLCGVPTDTWLSLQLQQDGRTGAVVRAVVSDSLGIALYHLSLAASASRGAGDSLESRDERISAAPRSGSAMVSGVVRGAGDVPLALAEVGVRGTSARTKTDELGRYSLSALPAGTQVLDVRRIGYDPAERSVELISGAVATADVQLRRIVNLDSVRIVARRSRYAEFNQQVKHGLFGVFIGPEELEHPHASFASDLIERIPGFRVENASGPLARVKSNRGSSSVFMKCNVNVVIDGLQGQSINDVSLAEVGAIAAYREGEMAPAEYHNACGVIEIWTKR